MNVKNVVDFLEEARNWYLNHRSDNSTFYKIIDKINNMNFAIVVGWEDGFEEDENDKLQDGTWHICAKIAYQFDNSICQCDYDVDWIVPYDNKSGDVIDTSIIIYENDNLEDIANFLIANYKSDIKYCYKKEGVVSKMRYYKVSDTDEIVSEEELYEAYNFKNDLDGIDNFEEYLTELEFEEEIKLINA